MKCDVIKKNIVDKFGIEFRNPSEFETLALLESKIDKKVLTFLDSSKYIGSIQDNVSMLCTTPDIACQLEHYVGGLIITENPRLLFFELHNEFANNMSYVRKQCENQISPNANISDMAYVASRNVIIEDDVIVEPFACIYENTILRKGSIIRSGAVIGGCGFEYKRRTDDIMAVAHYGGVIIDEYVEIQNHTCIDRAVYPWDNTIVGRHTKIDNLVYVGHAVKIGRNVLITAGAVIGGRTEIEDNCWIGINSVLRNGLVIGENARVNMGAVVTRSVPSGESVTGNFAIPHEKFIENLKAGR